jgi:hypothetical protein
MLNMDKNNYYDVGLSTGKFFVLGNLKYQPGHNQDTKNLILLR